MDNFLYIPFINPVKFFDPAQTNLDAYRTKHFDDYDFKDRLYPWQSNEDYDRIWQTSDIIKLQFESTFDPIIVKLLDENQNAVITLPALIGLPNKFLANCHSFEVEMSLAGLPTGCYRVQILAGTGDESKTLLSGCQYISDTLVENTMLLEYFNSRFHEDVIFETGIKFQARVHGNIGLLDPGQKNEQYKDERYNPALLSSKTIRQWPVFFGDEFGLPDDMIDLLNRIWSCDNVSIDGTAFGLADGSKFEFTEIEGYPKRGVKLVVEEGINRHSRIFAINTDTTKKLLTTIIVEAKVFGDMSNLGSANTVPVINIE